jgi:hypothetical protein
MKLLTELSVAAGYKSHAKEIVQNGLGDHLCIKCERLRISDQCPRYHHNSKQEMIRWNCEVDSRGVHESAHCTACGLGRDSVEGVWHDGRHRWLERDESVADKFRWHARQIAWQATHSKVIPSLLGSQISHSIYEKFLMELRPGHATVVGAVHRAREPR